MTDPDLIQALDRAERALARIERAAVSKPPTNHREEQLRAKVREVVSELDSIIGAGAR